MTAPQNTDQPSHAKKTDLGKIPDVGCRWADCAHFYPGWQVYCGQECRKAASKARLAARPKRPPAVPLPCEVCGADSRRGFCQKHSCRCRICGQQGKRYYVQVDNRTIGPYCRKHFFARGGRPAGTPTSKVSDEAVIAAMQESTSFREAAARCGLSCEALRSRFKKGARLARLPRPKCAGCGAALRRRFGQTWCSLECRRVTEGSVGSRIGHVYVIQPEGLPYVKIGFTVNGRTVRLAQLQSANPCKLKLLRWIPASEADEAALHRRYAGNRVRGEWFDAAILESLPE